MSGDSAEDEVAADPASVGEGQESDPLEDLKRQQKAELKAFQDEILARKKTINKTDKKKRKDLNTWIATEEANLSAKHEKEIQDFDAKQRQSEATSVAQVEEAVKALEVQPKRVSKAEKRREKKAQQVRERDDRIAEAEAEEADGERSVEIRAMTEILQRRGLKPFEVPPDGDCLFSAISHQLSLYGERASVSALRKSTADALRSDAEHFAPFVTNSAEEDAGDDSFQDYCDQMENTAAWGGHVELQALSRAMDRQIEVIQAAGPPLVFGDSNEGGPKLTIAYYRRAFGLGEHYESTQSA